MADKDATISKLTGKQKRFCEEYIIDLNALAACKRAGYSQSSAKISAVNNMANYGCVKYIEKLLEPKQGRISFTADMVLDEIRKLATVDLGEAYDENGRLLPIKQMPEHIRKAIASIETVEERTMDDEGNPVITEKTRKIRFYDKTKCLEMSGKYHRLFAEKIELTGRVTLEQIILGTKDEK